MEVLARKTDVASKEGNPVEVTGSGSHPAFCTLCIRFHSISHSIRAILHMETSNHLTRRTRQSPPGIFVPQIRCVPWRQKSPAVEARHCEYPPERMVDLAGLTEKQRRFCDEYLIDLNATQAAIRAGYSPKTAAAIAAENLTKPKVAENIKKRMNEKEDALIAKQDEVLKYLTAVMRREMKEFVVVTCMEEKTEVIPGEGGSKPTRRTTKKEEPKVVEIPARLCDANKAAELLGKRYGLFTDRVDVSGSLPVILAGEDALDD